MDIEVKNYERKFHDARGDDYEETWVKPERFKQHYRRMAIGVRKLLTSSTISVLDVGCGTGRSSLIFASLSPFDTIVGIDISKNLLSIMKRKAKSNMSANRMHIILCDAENMPLKTSSFDLVMYWEILHHLPNNKESLYEAKRVLKVLGFCSIHEPNKDSSARAHYFLSLFFSALSYPFRSQPEGSVRKQIYSKYEKTLCLDDLGKMLTKIGFSLIELKTISFFRLMPSHFPNAIAHPIYLILNKIDKSLESRLGKKCITVFAICRRT